MSRDLETCLFTLSILKDMIDGTANTYCIFGDLSKKMSIIVSRGTLIAFSKCHVKV